ILAAASGHYLNLPAGVASELGAHAVGSDLQFRHRIHADAIREHLVHADISHVLAIYGEIVLIPTLAIDGGGTGVSRGVRRTSGHGPQQGREISISRREVHHLPA